MMPPKAPAAITVQMHLAIRQAFLDAGLQPAAIDLKFQPDGKVLTATGFYADGATPFGLSTPPFHDDPLDRANAMVAGLIAAQRSRPPSQQGPTRMSKLAELSGLVTGLKQKLEAGADEIARHAAAVEDFGKDVIAQQKAVLDGHMSDLRRLQDELNQITNG